MRTKNSSKIERLKGKIRKNHQSEMVKMTGIKFNLINDEINREDKKLSGSRCVVGANNFAFK